MLTTRFTEMVGCTVPIQQAGMALLAGPDLAVTVAEAGGLGQISIFEYPDPARIARVLDDARTRTHGAIGANALGPDPHDELDIACLRAAASRARVVDYFWADPDPKLVEVAHAGGALACWQVGSLAEAIAAERAGCDFIIAQGVEAGGHVRGHIGLLALLTQVLDAVHIPVLAAGGIGSGRAMAAALAAGAAGVRVGTRFVVAPEAHAHPLYVQALIAAQPADTIYGDFFNYGWKDAPHRVLRSSVSAAEAFRGDIVARRLDPDTNAWVEKHRLQSFSVTDQYTGTIEAAPFWAGESVAGITRVQTAAEIVTELADEAEALLRRW
ncbi:MAG TPA: nitronate monooxygenase [Ktedonobacterales bacterium]|jgi:NAD(P)H-dependent flavin oxidoreductase YrpB (nitropropane dioxygenase family)